MNNFFSLNCRPVMVNHNLVSEAVKNFAAANFTDITEVQLGDIKVCVSEAYTNAVVFAFPELKTDHIIILTCTAQDNILRVTLTDNGVGIEDIQQARKPMFTTDSDGNRSGMGFTVMESFSTTLDVFSNKETGTTVSMTFKIKSKEQ